MRNHISARIEGLSAYEIAVLEGFEGPVEDWLKSLKGNKGTSIARITKLSESGNTDTYKIQLDDGKSTTFEVKNGKEIESVVKLDSTELTSTLLFNFNDGTTATVEVPNGTGVASIELESSSENGLIDTYKITYTDKEPSFFTVKNGVSIVSVEKTATDGIVDTYTIHFSDGTETTYELVNAVDTIPIDYADRFYPQKYYLINLSKINQQIAFTPTEDGDPPEGYRDPKMTVKSLAVKVRAGQMFKIRAKSNVTTFAYAEGHTGKPILREAVTGEYEGYYPIKKDGWIFVNTLIDYDSYVKKVTIFDEVEENQRLLKQAVDSIPTVEEVTAAVLAALPAAEGGAF